MSLPFLLLAFLVASLYGTLYHLWRGGGPKRIFFFLLLAWMGFFSGHFLAVWKGWVIYQVGSLYLGFGSLGALIFLIIGDWLGKLDAKD